MLSIMSNSHDWSLRLLDLLRREQGAMAEFLVALADFDRRPLRRATGYCATYPPSITTGWPVMPPEASAARKSA
jgi:hypothetical protein